tara:strand:+ start:1130 stop:1369 length:240 start_codon:yes stop_codon:yes gene_type:complete
MSDEILDGIVTELFDKFVHEIKKKKNSNYIKTYLIDPSLSYCIDALYPYIIISSLFLIIFFSIMLSIFVMTLKSYMKQK